MVVVVSALLCGSGGTLEFAAAVRGGPVIAGFIRAPEEEGHYYPGRVSRWLLEHSLAQLHSSLGSLGMSIINRRSSPPALLASSSTISMNFILVSRDKPVGVSQTDNLPSATHAESDVLFPFQRNPEAAKVLEMNKAQLKNVVLRQSLYQYT